MQTKLSFLQRVILQALLDLHIEGEACDVAFKAARPEVKGMHDRTKIWGAMWQPSKLFQDYDRAVSADISRAVARLEKRGLVIRQSANHGSPDSGKVRTSPDSMPPIRCTHILLTTEGRAVADALKETANI
jgi:hypothetical protein